VAGHSTVRSAAYA